MILYISYKCFGSKDKHDSTQHEMNKDPKLNSAESTDQDNQQIELKIVNNAS